jgi:uncharacterized protein with GYD domain
LLGSALFAWFIASLSPFLLSSFRLHLSPLAKNLNPKEPNIMAKYVSLLQFTDQGIRSVKDTVQRAAAATAEAEKMGAKITQAFWTMGAYDLVLLVDAPDEETVSAFSLKLGSLGNVKSETMRAFGREEMENILAKIK